MQGLIEMNKRLKARNTFLEKENGVSTSIQRTFALLVY